jgi:hypothetical protein
MAGAFWTSFGSARSEENVALALTPGNVVEKKLMPYGAKIRLHRQFSIVECVPLGITLAPRGWGAFTAQNGTLVTGRIDNIFPDDNQPPRLAHPAPPVVVLSTKLGASQKEIFSLSPTQFLKVRPEYIIAQLAQS